MGTLWPAFPLHQPAFTGKLALLAESSLLPLLTFPMLTPVQAIHTNRRLQAVPQEDPMGMRQPFLTKLKTIAGWVLFLVGSLMLNGRVDGLWHHVQGLTERFGAGVIGFLPAF